MRNFINTYYPGLFLFVFFFLVTCYTFRDYGMAWDEGPQLTTGRINYDYIFNGSTTLKTYPDRDYGAGFELLLTSIEKTFKIKDPGDLILMRHFVSHIFFLVGIFCIYILAFRLFKEQFIACLGFLILALTPRIYAHSFFNTKDIPFLSMFAICLLLANLAFEKNKTGWYLLLGMACGYLTGIRIVGIVLFAAINLFFAIDLVFSFVQKKNAMSIVKNAILFIVGATVLLYISWPNLWTDPVNNFLEAYKNSSHFRWTGTVLFQGHFYKATNLPLNYLPTWFVITTPVLWIVLGIAGILSFLFAIIKTPVEYLKNTPKRNFTLYGICLFIPVAAVIVLHAVIYDDWRHLYFTYVPFVLLILFVINELWKTKFKLWIIISALAQFVFIILFMVKNHPFQQVYFNELISRSNEHLRKNYDLDYWGCAYKQGIQYIFSHDPSAEIKVSGQINMIENNKVFLPASVRERIVTIDENSGEDADYFITNFRWHPADFPLRNTFYEIRMENSTIMRVYKLH